METRYTLDVAASLEQVLVEETGGVATTYLYGLGRIAYRESTAEWSYYLADGLGNVRAEVSAAGVVLTVRRFSPFGEPLQGGDGGTPFGYTGEQWDGQTQLLYLRARYYSPQQGRFVSKDPFPGFVNGPQTLSRYLYVGNNPVNGTDPSGYICVGGIGNCEEEPDMIGGVVEYIQRNAPIPADLCLPADWGCWGGSEAADFYRQYYRNLPESNQWVLSHPLEALGKRTVWPDYYALTYSSPPLPLIRPVAGAVVVVIDRYGRSYVGVGGNIGRGISRGSFSLTGGYLLTGQETSDEAQLASFITSHSLNFSGGYYGGAGLTWGNVGCLEKRNFAYELGLYTPQLGLTYTYSFLVYDFRKIKIPSPPARNYNDYEEYRKGKRFF